MCAFNDQSFYLFFSLIFEQDRKNYIKVCYFTEVTITCIDKSFQKCFKTNFHVLANISPYTV